MKPVLKRKLVDGVSRGKIRVQTVVDTFSRYVPVLDVLFSYWAENLVQTLKEVCKQADYPKTIGSIKAWSLSRGIRAYAHDVILDFSRPSKPTDNAIIDGLQRASA